MDLREHPFAPRVWLPATPSGVQIARPTGKKGRSGDCCDPCRKRREEAGAGLPDLARGRAPVGLFDVLRAMGSNQSTGMKIAARPSRNKSNAASYDYVVQIRRLRMPPIGIHEDVCVHDTCYTTGPSEGIYRRDASSSAWALTDADGWSTPDGWSFGVTQSERDQCRIYMDDIIAGPVSRDGFLSNIWEYYSNGYCITFSRRRFNEMVNMIADSR